MAAPDPEQYKRITQDLYLKNTELVNANKTLELLQELYEIMINTYSVQEVAQQFIDIVSTKLGFPDGLVAIKSRSNNHLQVIALTKTEINKTIVEMGNLTYQNMNIPLEYKDNTLTSVFSSAKAAQTNNLINIWTPILKPDDLKGISDIAQNQNYLVYPIIFGQKVLGCFALSLANNIQTITEFEKQTLSRLITVFGIAVDRTTIYSDLQAAQKRELAKAKEVIKLKDEFVFIATHDLRTPVTAFLGYIDLIKNTSDQLSADTHENIDAIVEAGNRLDQLVEDLLEVARSESGTLKVAVSPVNMSNIIQESVRQVAIPAKKKNVTITTNLNQERQTVLGDKDKLAEVMENLLSNAVKFSRDQGTIQVTTQLTGNMLQVSVADNGFGIPKDKHDKIFQKFFKHRGSSTADVPGTGLGLFVVRMLIEKMKGKITFTSEKNKGTTFTFVLPLANTPA